MRSGRRTPRIPWRYWIQTQRIQETPPSQILERLQQLDLSRSKRSEMETLCQRIHADAQLLVDWPFQFQQDSPLISITHYIPTFSYAYSFRSIDTPVLYFTLITHSVGYLRLLAGFGSISPVCSVYSSYRPLSYALYRAELHIFVCNLNEHV